MKFLNKLRKYSQLRFYAGLALVGLLFAAAMAVVLSLPKEPMGDVEVRIVDIREEWSTTSDGMDHDVFVTYEVDGVTYEHIRYGSYNSSMKVGDVLNAKYRLSDPSYVEAPDAFIVPFVVGGAGLIALIAGIVGLVRSIRTSSDDMDEYDRADVNEATEEQIEEIRERSESTNRYYFHFGHFLNQGYLLENGNHGLVYDAQMKRMTLFRPFTFEFINCRTGRSVTRKIGHTVSKSIYSGGSFSFRVPISRSFTVDGLNNWDFIAAAGFGFDWYMEGIKPCYTVKHYGVPVATIRTSGANLFEGEGEKKVLGGNTLPVNGYFRVDCNDEDLDMVFMICFSISRAIFFED